MIRILIVDDHRLMREGLRAIIESESDMRVVGEASDGREALDLVGRETPDVALVDVGMPNLNGVETTRCLTRDHEQVKVLGLSVHKDGRFVMSMLNAGAAGYVVKDAAGEELTGAVRTVAKGERYLSSEVTGAVVTGALSEGPANGGGVSDLLTGREREVVQMLAEGKTSGEIAGALSISLSTAETHRRNVMRKLNVHNAAELTRLALREGLTTLD